MMKTMRMKKTSHVSLIAIAVVFGLALSSILETGRSRAADSPDSVSHDSAPPKVYRWSAPESRTAHQKEFEKKINQLPEIHQPDGTHPSAGASFPADGRGENLAVGEVSRATVQTDQPNRDWILEVDRGHSCSSVTTRGLRVSASVDGHALKSRHLSE